MSTKEYLQLAEQLKTMDTVDIAVKLVQLVSDAKSEVFKELLLPEKLRPSNG